MPDHATTTSPGAWPINLGAYAKAIAGSLTLIPTGLLTTTVLDAPMLAAYATTAASHLALLLAGSPRLKRAVTITGAVVAAVILGASQREGEPGLTLAGIAQWDFTDLAFLLAVALGTVLHLTGPNAPAIFPATSDADVAHLLPAPETAAASPLTLPVAAESVTALLPVIPAPATAADDALPSEAAHA